MAVLQAIGGIMAAGKKPVVPKFEKVDASQEQGNAIKQNLANFGAANELASQTNEATQEQLLESLRKAIPGFDSIVQKGGSALSSQLSGQIPKDVQDAIQTNAAAQSLAGGFAGAKMNRNLVARDLAMTSLQITNQALDSASRWMANLSNVAVGPQFNVSSMFLTPQQRIAHEVGERDTKFNRDLFQAKIDSMPDPKKAAIGQALISTEQTVLSSLGSIAGMAGGMCWVAREVYGVTNPKWIEFRDWLLTSGPKWLVDLYRTHGEWFAGWISGKPLIKMIIRRMMDYAIAGSHN